MWTDSLLQRTESKRAHVILRVPSLADALQKLKNNTMLRWVLPGRCAMIRAGRPSGRDDRPSCSTWTSVTPRAPSAERICGRRLVSAMTPVVLDARSCIRSSDHWQFGLSFRQRRHRVPSPTGSWPFIMKIFQHGCRAVADVAFFSDDVQVKCVSPSRLVIAAVYTLIPCRVPVDAAPLPLTRECACVHHAWATRGGICAHAATAVRLKNRNGRSFVPVRNKHFQVLRSLI